MSNFTDIYNKARAAIPTLTGFSTKTEIPNPYSLEDNSNHLLRNGWGIKVGQSSPNIENDMIPSYITAQDFEIVLTRAVMTTANNADPTVTAVQGIRDDINIIEKDFTGTRFGISDQVENVDINIITSVDNVSSGKYNYITASIIFEITHWR